MIPQRNEFLKNRRVVVFIARMDLEFEIVVTIIICLFLILPVRIILLGILLTIVRILKDHVRQQI